MVIKGLPVQLTPIRFAVFKVEQTRIQHTHFELWECAVDKGRIYQNDVRIPLQLSK